MRAKLLSLVMSRRFLTAVVGVVAVLLSDAFGLDESQTIAIGGIVVAWIVGDSIRVTR